MLNIGAALLNLRAYVSQLSDRSRPPMRPEGRLVIVRWQRCLHTTSRRASAQPPQPRSYRPIPPEERISRHPPIPEDPVPAPEPQRGIFSWFGGRPNIEAAAKPAEPLDPARGVEAAKRVVREGVLDEKYRPAARRVTAIFCALPIVIGLSYELYGRLFLGVEQKTIPTRGKAIEDT